VTSTEREEVAALLDRAAERVERGWCQGAGALDADGLTVNANNPRACRWCNLAAIWAEIPVEVSGFQALSDPSQTTIRAAEAQVMATMGWPATRTGVLTHQHRLVDWNDAPERTQAEVVAALRETARRVREGE